MGRDGLDCMVRDPHWIYCHWELAGDALERAARGRSPRFLETARWVLRVSMAEGEPRDVRIDPAARSWYLKAEAGRRWRVELGLVTEAGEFVALVPGGEVETPPEPLGEIAGRDWGPLGGEIERFVEQGLVGSSVSYHALRSGVPTSGTSKPGAP